VSDIFPAAMQRRLEAEWAKPAIKIDVTAIPDYSPDRHELPAGKQANIYNVAYLLLMAGVNPDLRVQIWRHGRPIMIGQIGYAAARYVCEQSKAGLMESRRECDVDRGFESGSIKLTQEQIRYIVDQIDLNEPQAPEGTTRIVLEPVLATQVPGTCNSAAHAAACQQETAHA
jgi:hypothetical protein